MHTLQIEAAKYIGNYKHFYMQFWIEINKRIWTYGREIYWEKCKDFWGKENGTKKKTEDVWNLKYREKILNTN